MTSLGSASPASRATRRHTMTLTVLLTLLVGLSGSTLLTTPPPDPLPQAALQYRINPNIAPAAELELLPRIGPKMAQYIIAYRRAAASQPAFATPDDLDAVHRIGPATIALLRPLVDCNMPSSENLEGIR